MNISRAASASLNRLWRLRRWIRRRRRSRQREDAPLIAVAGPGWLRDLIGATHRLGDVTAAGDAVDLVVVGPGGCPPAAASRVVSWRHDCPGAIALDPGPFIEPQCMSPLATNWSAPGAPGDVVALAEAARRLPPPPSPLRRRRQAWGPWLQATRAAHVPYRASQQRTTTDVINEGLEATGGAAVRRRGAELVTVVCVTRRAGNLGAVVSNFRRQVHPVKELIVVTNDLGIDPGAFAAAVKAESDIRVLAGDPGASLGVCLNLALGHTEARRVAKMDDDDFYGPDYLGDLVIAQRFSAAAVTGKHSHYAWMQESSEGYLRFPGREFEFTDWLAGGTLLIDRNQIGDMQFDDVSLGEDAALLAACRRRGLDLFAADRFNYAQVRHGDNTWAVEDQQYLQGALVQPGRSAQSLAQV